MIRYTNEYDLFMEGKQERYTYRMQRVMKTYHHFGYERTKEDAEKFQKIYLKNQNSLKKYTTVYDQLQCCSKEISRKV